MVKVKALSTFLSTCDRPSCSRSKLILDCSNFESSQYLHSLCQKINTVFLVPLNSELPFMISPLFNLSGKRWLYWYMLSFFFSMIFCLNFDIQDLLSSIVLTLISATFMFKMLLYQHLFQHFVVCTCQRKEAKHFAIPEYFRIHLSRIVSKQRKYKFLPHAWILCRYFSSNLKEMAILVLVYT